jgi:Uma2 family endonuclease
MAVKVPRAVLNWEHYLELPNDGKRYEIIDGELYVSPAPSEKHQRVATTLTAILVVHNVAHRIGAVYAAPFDVRLAWSDIVQPDLLFVSRQRANVITSARIDGAPDLVVEIISPSSVKTDEDTKRNLYAKYGVKYYWIIEPLEEWIRAYELGADGLYELVAEAHGSETFSAPPFVDLQISLADLWADPMAGN